MTFRRLIAAAGLCLSLAACLPGMSPSGSPANPVGVTSPGDTDSSSSKTKEDEGFKTGPEGSDFVPRSGRLSDVPNAGGGDVPVPPPSPGGGGGGGDSSDWREKGRQIAGGGGFCPKPDEVSLENNYQRLDWRALQGYGVWSEMSKTDAIQLSIGDNVPFDLYLDVQAFFANERCRFWEEPFPAVVVRLIFRATGSDVAQAVDVVTQEKHPDGYNAAFHGLIAKNGRIDVYAYEVAETLPDGTPKVPGGYRTALADLSVIHEISFTGDTAHAHYLGSFATKITVKETNREILQQLMPPR
jgi:hypothetical protein